MTATPFLLRDPTRLHADASIDDLIDAMIVALETERFAIECCDDQKPWGVEFKIRGDQARAFLERYFADIGVPSELREAPAGPKILLIRQGSRLSWHVHARKEALLRILHGNVGASLSETDTETVAHIHVVAESIRIPPGIRHRLCSVSGWAVVAEIARDVVPGHPSDDEDTRRISDDYGR